jgi:hypothetical protein
VFFDVRKAPALAHFLLVVCNAALDEDDKARSNNGVQTPMAKPRRLFIA